MAIHFFTIDIKIRLHSRRRLKSFITSIFETHGFKMKSLNIVFCSDKYLLNINQVFLNHDTFTDIITFPLSEIGEPIKGEIYISIDRISENASRFNTTYELELHRVIFHGVLHLCGFKDKTKEDKASMRRLEREALNLYFG